MTASTPDRARGSRSSAFGSAPSHSAAIMLRLVARRHVDLHRVSSALCR